MWSPALTQGGRMSCLRAIVELSLQSCRDPFTQPDQHPALLSLGSTSVPCVLTLRQLSRRLQNEMPSRSLAHRKCATADCGVTFWAQPMLSLSVVRTWEQLTKKNQWGHLDKNSTLVSFFFFFATAQSPKCNVNCVISQQTPSFQYQEGKQTVAVAAFHSNTTTGLLIGSVQNMDR